MLIVKVRLVVPLTLIVLTPKALLTVGDKLTESVSAAVFPLPPLPETTAVEVLSLMPTVCARIFTLTTQSRPAATVAPEKVRLVSAATGLKVGNPQFVDSADGLAATCRPMGRLSVKPTPVRAMLESVFGLEMVKVNVGLASSLTESGLKTLLMTGGATTTMLAVLETIPVPPSVEVITEVVLSLEPLLVPYTRTLTVQVEFAGMLPLLNVRLVAPEAGPKLGVPQPEVLAVGVVQTAKPDGRASVNATPFKIEDGLGLTNVKLSVA